MIPGTVKVALTLPFELTAAVGTLKAGGATSCDDEPNELTAPNKEVPAGG